MPHFIDIHEIEGVTADAVAKAHLADMAVQDKYGVNYVKYWLNESRGKIFCLCSAPDAAAADRVHRESHGLAAERIIEVDPDLAEGFLGGGRVAETGVVLLDGSRKLDPGQRTILFTDIVGSTALTQRLGDKAAMEVVDLHDTVVRAKLRETGGREVKHLGDGIMAAFVSAPDAVRCAALIQQELPRASAGRTPHVVSIRIGVASGEPVERNGDFFGSTVQLAARLCAAAQPGETLVAAEVNQLCPGASPSFVDRGQLTLKGFDRAIQAYALRRE